MSWDFSIIKLTKLRSNLKKKELKKAKSTLLKIKFFYKLKKKKEIKIM